MVLIVVFCLCAITASLAVARCCRGGCGGGFFATFGVGAAGSAGTDVASGGGGGGDFFGMGASGFTGTDCSSCGKEGGDFFGVCGGMGASFAGTDGA